MGACREVSPPIHLFGAQACLIGSDLRDPKDLNVYKPPSGREATMPIADRHIFLTFVYLYNGVLIAVSCRQDHLDCSL